MAGSPLSQITLDEILTKSIMGVREDRDIQRKQTITSKYIFGTWRSLVAYYLGVVGVAGSNPVVPKFLFNKSLLRHSYPTSQLQKIHFIDIILLCKSENGLTQ